MALTATHTTTTSLKSLSEGEEAVEERSAQGGCRQNHTLAAAYAAVTKQQRSW